MTRPLKSKIIRFDIQRDRHVTYSQHSPDVPITILGIPTVTLVVNEPLTKYQRQKYFKDTNYAEMVMIK